MGSHKPHWVSLGYLNSCDLLLSPETLEKQSVYTDLSALFAIRDRSTFGRVDVRILGGVWG